MQGKFLIETIKLSIYAYMMKWYQITIKTRWGY